MSAVYDGRVWDAGACAFVQQTLEGELVLGLQRGLRAAVVAPSVALHEFRGLVEAVKECVRVCVARLSGKLSNGHLKVVTDDGIDEEMCVPVVRCGMGVFCCRQFGDAA